MGMPDMRGPIQYALGYPRRFAGPVPPLDLGAARTLEFAAVDRQRFPGLDLAYAALAAGGTAPAALNAANEVAVHAFLEHRLAFPGIARVIERTLEAADRQAAAPASLADVRAADDWARAFAAETIRTLRSS
jgi:1-deoxy-D-xylulose-5-phosphate reductoisomerase